MVPREDRQASYAAVVNHAGEERRSADTAGQERSAGAASSGEDVAPGSLRCRTDRRGDTVTIQLGGELELATVPSFESARAQLGSEFAVMVLDLSALDFIDSSGLRAVINTTHDADALSARLEIVPGPPAVQRVFEITGLTQRLPFRED
jgi:anti-anti-sigma factor